MRVKMSKPPPPAPTASAIGPCPTVIKIVGRPGTGSLPSTIAPADHPINEIATFHNGGTSSSKYATLIISVFFLLQKIMKTVLLSISFQIILLLFIFSICSQKEATFASQYDIIFTK